MKEKTKEQRLHDKDVNIRCILIDYSIAIEGLSLNDIKDNLKWHKALDRYTKKLMKVK